jgi:hypothetical protein
LSRQLDLSGFFHRNPVPLRRDGPKTEEEILPSVTNLKSNRRGGASIALLAALLAIGGAQAFAPAPAAAMIDMGGECGDPITFDSSYCDESGGGGGQAGTGGGSTSGDTENWQRPEVIEVRDPGDPCRRSPASCLPKQTGGGRQARADGPRIPFRSRHGARPTRVAEIPLTYPECRTLARGWAADGLMPGLAVLGSDVIANRVDKEAAQVRLDIVAARGTLERLRNARAELGSTLTALVPAHSGLGGRSKILEFEEDLVKLNSRIADQERQLNALERLFSDKLERLQRLVEANWIAHKALRGECGRRYPKLFD